MALKTAVRIGNNRKSKMQTVKYCQAIAGRHCEVSHDSPSAPAASSGLVNGESVAVAALTTAVIGLVGAGIACAVSIVSRCVVFGFLTFFARTILFLHASRAKRKPRRIWSSLSG